MFIGLKKYKNCGKIKFSKQKNLPIPVMLYKWFFGFFLAFMYSTEV